MVGSERLSHILPSIVKNSLPSSLIVTRCNMCGLRADQRPVYQHHEVDQSEATEASVPVDPKEGIAVKERPGDEYQYLPRTGSKKIFEKLLWLKGRWRSSRREVPWKRDDDNFATRDQQRRGGRCRRRRLLGACVFVSLAMFAIVYESPPRDSPQWLTFVAAESYT